MKVKGKLPAVINRCYYPGSKMMHLINGKELCFGRNSLNVMPENIILPFCFSLQRLEEIMKRTRRVEAVDKVSAAT